LLAVLCASAIAPCSGVLYADTLVTKSGGRFEGQVEEREYHYILTTPKGARMTFPKEAVHEVVRSPLPPPRESGPARPAETTTTEQTQYMEIPIEGEIGTAVLAKGVQEALDWARRITSIRHVVFRVRSPGGYVDEAEKIAQVMDAYRGTFTYHAFVNEASSAAIWIVFACDTIHMAPSSTFGGAVAYRISSSGNVDVDAKINSILGAKVRTLAERQGHSGAVANAMVVRQAAVYAWRDATGKVSIAEHCPSGVSAEDTILTDTDATVLTLTEGQAVRAGIAKAVVDGVAGIGIALGLPGWRKASGYGEKSLVRAKKDRDREVKKRETEARDREVAIQANIERTKATILYIDQNTREATRNDPANFTYVFDTTTGLYTLESLRKRIAQTDRAIAAWNRVLVGVSTLVNREKEADRLGIPRAVHPLNLNQIALEAGRKIAQLQEDRNRIGP
jgi:hypothetical protein